MPDGELANFAQKWSLDEDAQKLLRGLPGSAQARLLQTFAPPDTTRDVNGIFVKYAKSLEARHRPY